MFICTWDVSLEIGFVKIAMFSYYFASDISVCFKNDHI